MELLKMNRHFQKLKIPNGTGGTSGPGIDFFNIKGLHWDHWKSTLEKHLKKHTKMDLNTLKETIKSIGLFLGRSSSPIVAQRICRSYQILHLHSRLWSTYIGSTIGSLPPAGKSSSRIIVSKFGPKPWFLSFIIFSLYDQKNESNKHRDSSSVALIEESELFSHMRDLDYIHELTTSTVICPECNNRLVIDKKLQNVQYCLCNSSGGHAVERDFNGKKWSPFVETPDLLIWRQPHETNAELYKYKVYGHYNDITPREFLATQLDLDYRKEWDTLVLDLEVVDHDAEHGIDIVYWEMIWPKMFSNRDYCFARRFIVNEDDGTIVIMNKSIAHNKVPEKTGAVRVKEYSSVMQIKGVNGLDEPGVEFGLTYFDNPGLSLPGWLLNWAAMSGIPEFLSKVHNAARVRRKSVSVDESKSQRNIESNRELPSEDAEPQMPKPNGPKANQQSQSKSTPSKPASHDTTSTVPPENIQSHPRNASPTPSQTVSQSQTKPTRAELLSKIVKEMMIEATLSEA